MVQVSSSKAGFSRKEDYLSAFESFEKRNAKNPLWMDETRKAAMKRFARFGFPTMREENWRYTNVRPIEETPFQFFSDSPKTLLPSALETFDLGQKKGYQLVFINGLYHPKLSRPADSKGGLYVRNLESVLTSNPKFVEPYLARLAHYDQDSFTALNTAFIREGAFIYLPEGEILDQPIHILFVSVSNPNNMISQPRTLIVAGKDSKATVIESYVSSEDICYFTNAVTEISLAEGSSMDHLKIQRESTRAFHVGTAYVREDSGSTFTSFSFAVGSLLGRNNLNVALDGKGAECELNGLYLAAGSQHIDNNTLIDHPKPCGTSHQVYKGILAGRATGIFSGKIFVHQDSQKTDAHQVNKNLLLSKEAQMTTKPHLEILADDVKCTHGAAVGQLDEEAIFYLKTRGISQEAAAKLLSYGFANEVINDIQIEGVRDELNRLVSEWLEKPAYWGAVS